MADKEKILTIVDKETGEVEARIKLEDRVFGKQRWLAMFQKSLAWISEQKDMTGEQLKVMLNLLSKMEYDNRIVYKRGEVAKEVGIQPQHVSRALRVLKEKNIIYEDPNDDNVYKLNPYIGHKGTKKYKSNIIEFEKTRFEK